MSKVEIKSTIKVSDGDVAVEYESDTKQLYFWNGGVLEGSCSEDYIDILIELLSEVRKEVNNE